MRRFISTLLVCLVIPMVGCAHASARINDLSLGMTKPEVIAVMGEPNSRSMTSPDREILVYEDHHNGWKDFWLVLENGKLTQFGEPQRGSSSIQPVFQVPLKTFQPVIIK